MSPTDVDVQSWGSWAIQVEECAGVRLHGDIVEEAMDAWQAGESPQTFAARMVEEHCDAPAGVDRRAVPFADPDDPSSPLLASGFVALMLVAVGVLLGWAIAPSLMELFR